jgi:hypothetical protein
MPTSSGAETRPRPSDLGSCQVLYTAISSSLYAVSFLSFFSSNSTDPEVNRKGNFSAYENICQNGVYHEIYCEAKIYFFYWSA